MTSSANPSRTSELLQNMAEDETKTDYSFAEIMQRFHHRAFGMLLLILTLPNFIPAPIGIGGILGPLVALLGLQLMLGFDHPWLPKWFRHRQISRETIGKLHRRLGGTLRFIERLSKPRVPSISKGVGLRFTGLMLIGLGVALALPIPFTNYPFGFVLLTYAIALIERDGFLMIICWLVGIAVLITFAHLGSAMVKAALKYFSS